MQVDPGPPTRQSRTSINYLLSPEQPSSAKFRSQSQRSQEPKPVKIPFQSIRCTSCEELINTTDGDGNQTGLWEMHTKKCTKASPTPSDASSASVIEDTTPFRRHKARVNEEERLAILRKDKQIVQIEEYQVLCAFCDAWIQLRKDRPYCSIAWTEHKLTCRRRQPSKKPSPKPLSTSKRTTREHTASSVVPAPPPDNVFTPSSSVAPNLGPPGLVINDSRIPPPPTLPSPLSSVLLNSALISSSHHHPRRSDPGPGGFNLPESSTYIITSPPQIRRTEAERVKLLMSDPNATTVEPHRVLCGVCGRWIQLRKNSTYCTAPWIQHVSKCVKRNGQNSTRNNSVQRTSTSMVQLPPRQATPSISRASAEQHQPAEREELESDADLEVEDVPQSSSSRRPRGRPRKRRNQNGHNSILGRRSISPIPPPSPPPNHPYPGHRYVYTSVPPILLSNHYAHSQYSTTDDSYAMYFDVEAMPASLLSQMTALPQFPPGEGKRWIVYQLQNYEKNGCPVKSVMFTTTGGTKEVVKEDDGDENMEVEKKESETDNVTAGDRVNDATAATDTSELSSLKPRNWSQSAASIDESSTQEVVARSTSDTPGEGSFHNGEQENNGVVATRARSGTPHRPAIPAYESPRLPREPYRSPHMDAAVSPEPIPQPVLPPSPPPSASIQPAPIPTPHTPPVPPRRRLRYLWESDDDSPPPRKTTAKPINNSPPPPAVPAPSQPPPLPQHHRSSVQTNYSVSSTASTSPAIPYRAQPQPQPPAAPVRLPPIPVLPPSGPYAIPPDPYHSPPPPVPQQRTGERDYHSPRHAVPIADKRVYFSPLPPPDSPPPRRRYYDPPGSSHHPPPAARHSIAGGMKYRSPAREDQRSSFPTNNSKKRSRQSRSRSPKPSIPPPRPVPTSMAQVSPEARLFYTHRCIAYLFQTTLKGAVDIPLMTLMTFMNDGFEPQDSRTNYFTFEEVRDCVAELGRRQMLIFTQEGGVQFGESAMDFD